MTNKPMLSVELRALLERASNNLCSGEEAYAVQQELRALLDEPDETFNLQGWSIDHSAGRPILMHNKCSVIEAEQAYGLLNLIETAAQNQGDPVAWRYKKSWEKTGWKVCDNHPTDYGIDDECYEIQALYAEQPAPVAVDAEILERFPEINFANYGQDEVEALQAWAFEAYEAIARLNGVKP